MRTMHLFAGAGGGLLADLILGHVPIVAIEHNHFCCGILRQKTVEGWFPGLEVVEDDIRNADFTKWLETGVDCVSAGFPCQDISLCNLNGQGIDGAKSGLWREIVRCVDALRPRYIFLENSPNIKTKGRDTILHTFMARGYMYRDCIFKASEVGTLHYRDRWFCLLKKICADTDSQRRWDDYTIDKPNVEWQSASLEPVDKRTIEAIAQYTERYGLFRPDTECSGMVDGMANKLHKAKRIKALGNGQVPLQIATIFKILMEGQE